MAEARPKAVDVQSSAMVTTSGDAILARMLTLFAGLRAAGVAVSMTEALDAARALPQLDLSNRPLLRAALSATLVKHLEDEPIFNRLFDIHFPLSRATPDATAGANGHGATTGQLGGRRGDPGQAGDTDRPASPSLLQALIEALRSGDADALRALAAMAVDAHAGIGSTAGSERYHLYRVLRATDLASLMAAVMHQLRVDAGADVDEFAMRLERDTHARLIDDFRRMIAEEIRGRLHHHTDQATAAYNLDGIDLLDASTTELRAMREAVRPLARKLASRVAQQRRLRRHGRLDMRRTIRQSLSSGGVMMQTSFRDRRTSKPDVVVLCDVSGSVAEFAHFTLLLLDALHDELANLRSFVFVDGVSEVTEVVSGSDYLDPRFLVTRPGVVVGDGHSDYGNVFARFLADHASGSITAATTLIVTGDGRSNHRSAGITAFREISRRAKRVYWLNPEPTSEWGTTDSAVAEFRTYCNAMFEVRNLRQLVDVVAELV